MKNSALLSLINRHEYSGIKCFIILSSYERRINKPVNDLLVFKSALASVPLLFLFPFSSKSAVVRMRAWLGYWNIYKWVKLSKHYFFSMK